METHRISVGAKATEDAMYARLAGPIPTFVRAFESNPGEARTFDARMDQALFLANGAPVRPRLVGRDGTLPARLEKLTGPGPADELYPSVVTRSPDDEERKEVGDPRRSRIRPGG